LPDPVRAWPTTSRPAISSGIDAAWMGVGSTTSIRVNTSSARRSRFISAKVVNEGSFRGWWAFRHQQSREHPKKKPSSSSGLMDLRDRLHTVRAVVALYIHFSIARNNGRVCAVVSSDRAECSPATAWWRGSAGQRLVIRDAAPPAETSSRSGARLVRKWTVARGIGRGHLVVVPDAGCSSGVAIRRTACRTDGAGRFSAGCRAAVDFIPSNGCSAIARGRRPGQFHAVRSLWSDGRG
jgi:hypothetical protein